MGLLFKRNAAGRKRLTLLGIVLAVFVGYMAVGAFRYTVSKSILAYDLYHVGQVLDHSLQEPEISSAISQDLRRFVRSVLWRQAINRTAALRLWELDNQQTLDSLYTHLTAQKLSPEQRATLDLFYAGYGLCCTSRTDRTPVATALSKLGDTSAFTRADFIDDYRYQLAYIMLADQVRGKMLRAQPIHNWWLSFLIYPADGGQLASLYDGSGGQMSFNDADKIYAALEPIYNNLGANYANSAPQKIMQLKIGYQIRLLNIMAKDMPYDVGNRCSTPRKRLITNYYKDLHVLNGLGNLPKSTRTLVQQQYNNIFNNPEVHNKKYSRKSSDFKKCDAI